MLKRVMNALTTNRAATAGGVVVTLLGLAAALIIGLPPPFMLGLLVAFGLVTWGIYRWRIRDLSQPPKPASGGMLASSALAALLVVFLAAQAVPYGRDHTNPPVTGGRCGSTSRTVATRSTIRNGIARNERPMNRSRRSRRARCHRRTTPSAGSTAMPTCPMMRWRPYWRAWRLLPDCRSSRPPATSHQPKPPLKGSRGGSGFPLP